MEEDQEAQLSLLTLPKELLLPTTRDSSITSVVAESDATKIMSALSFVLGYVSKSDAHRFNQGLYYLQDKGEKFKRAAATRDGHHFYLALGRTSSDFALSGSCVDIIFGRAVGRVGLCGASADGHWPFAARFKTYVEQKLRIYNLCSHTHKRKRLSA